MSKLIDWYLVELRLRLSNSLHQDNVDGIVREAESHLTESMRNRLGTGRTEEASAESAIAAFGDAGIVAKGFLRGTKQKLLGVNPVWWALIGSLVAIYGWNFHWLTLAGYFDNFGANWQNGFALAACGLGMWVILKAAKSGLKSYRLPVALFTLLAAGLSAPLMSWWMIPEPGTYYPGLAYEKGISRFHLSRDVPKVERTAKDLAAYKSFVERGIREYGASASDTSLSPDLRDSVLAAKEFGVERYYPASLGMKSDRGGMYVVPRRYGVYAEMDGRIDLLETMAFYSDAKKAWLTTGPADLKGLVLEQKSLQGLVDNINAAKTGQHFFFEPMLYTQTVYGTIVLLPALLLFDFIGARIGRPRRRSLSGALAQCEAL